jgi:hypothetical protein
MELQARWNSGGVEVYFLTVKYLSGTFWAVVFM